MNVTLRPEQPQEKRRVEELTRAAFWNRFAPGCTEHYFLHQMRTHPDFIPGLNFVALEGDAVVGHIAYCRTTLAREGKPPLPVLCFGPVSVLPGKQGQGIGGALIKKTLELAAGREEAGVIILGDPRYYHRFGFRSAEKWDITNGEGKFGPAMMALPLRPGALDAAAGIFRESEVFSHFDEAAFAAFDATFPPLEKGPSDTQADFAFLSGLWF